MIRLNIMVGHNPEFPNVCTRITMHKPKVGDEYVTVILIYFKGVIKV